MGSTQLNFFIVPEDWVHISRYLQEAGASMLSMPIATIDDLFISNFEEDNNAHKVYFTNQPPGKDIVLSPGTRGYTIDIVRSSVVEFSRGGFYPNSDRKLHRARFYTVLEYDENAYTVRKSKDFIDWVLSVYRNFRRKYLKKSDYDSDFLFSENAITWMKAHNALVDSSGLFALASSHG